MKKHNKYSWKFIYNIVIIGSLIGSIAGLTAVIIAFKKKPIASYYCYLKMGNGMYCMTTASKSIGRIISYYTDGSERINGSQNYFLVPNYRKVELLEFEKDTSFALIQLRSKMTYPPFRTIERGYVPVISLHDTLPRCYPDCFMFPEWYKQDNK